MVNRVLARLHRGPPLGAKLFPGSPPFSVPLALGTARCVQSTGLATQLDDHRLSFSHRCLGGSSGDSPLGPLASGTLVFQESGHPLGLRPAFVSRGPWVPRTGAGDHQAKASARGEDALPRLRSTKAPLPLLSVLLGTCLGRPAIFNAFIFAWNGRENHLGLLFIHVDAQGAEWKFTNFNPMFKALCKPLPAPE